MSVVLVLALTTFIWKAEYVWEQMDVNDEIYQIVGRPRCGGYPVARRRFHRERHAHLRKATQCCCHFGAYGGSALRCQGLLLQPSFQARTYQINFVPMLYIHKLQGFRLVIYLNLQSYPVRPMLSLDRYTLQSNHPMYMSSY